MKIKTTVHVTECLNLNPAKAIVFDAILCFSDDSDDEVQVSRPMSVRMSPMLLQAIKNTPRNALSPRDVNNQRPGPPAEMLDVKSQKKKFAHFESNVTNYFLALLYEFGLQIEFSYRRKSGLKNFLYCGLENKKES